jgi:thioredoxin 1
MRSAKLAIIVSLLSFSSAWAEGEQCQKSLSPDQAYLNDLVERSIAALKESGKFDVYDAQPPESLASEIGALEGNDPYLYPDLLGKRMAELTATPNVTEITSEEQFQRDVLGAKPGELIMVDVYGSGCVPCWEILPVIHQLADVYQGQITVVKVNIAKQKWYEKRYGGAFKSLSVPVIHFFRNGRVARKYGPWMGNRRQGIENRIQALLK